MIKPNTGPFKVESFDSTRHTSGPWIAKGDDGRYNNSKNSWVVFDEGADLADAAPITLSDGTVIAFAVASGDSQISDDRVDDAARLIAAAPELLSELEILANIIEGCGIELPPEVEGQLVFARAAIAKAKGESA